jgi:peptide/nickel transport system substrate-binding protein
MKCIKPARVTIPAVVSMAALGSALLPASLTPHTVKAASPIYMVSDDAFHPTGFTRLFSPYIATTMDYTWGAVFEPLMIITPVGGGHTYPWLASGYTYGDSGKTLTVTLRPNLKWSDGQPLTASDVAFTFNYGKKYTAADQNGLWAGKYLQSVSATNPTTVVFKLTSADSTLLPNIVSNIKIIPEHQWSKITNPGTYANPNPVGSGPFANVTNFTSQEFIYAKNKYYWQPLAYDGIKVPNFLDNNGANTAMEHGDLDWTGNFVADIQRAYVAKDPAHFHYYFAQTNPLGLWFNDLKYPYSLVGFRKALSYAVDRQRISNFAENGYELPADATGIKRIFPTWYNSTLDAQSTALSSYNPSKAQQLLLSMGFKMKNGQLYDPHGAKVSFTMVVPTGWSDWVLTLQLLAQDFKKIGIDASYKTIDQATWFSKSQAGQLDAHIHWTGYNVSPYYTYYSYMSRQSFTPIGTDASLNGQNNWERYTSSEATNLFAQYRATTDLQKQKQLIDQIQRIQLRDFPYIPIMFSADWYTYSMLHFTGWPTAQNFYVRGSSNDYPDRTMVMTRLKPVM